VQIGHVKKESSVGRKESNHASNLEVPERSRPRDHRRVLARDARANGRSPTEQLFRVHGWLRISPG
jgi:hypothetical protein